MNDDNKVHALSLKLEEICFNNNWELTAILFDGTHVTGQLIEHNTVSQPFQVRVTMLTDNDEETIIDLRNVQDIMK
jgi:hypothetical protein